MLHFMNNQTPILLYYWNDVIGPNIGDCLSLQLIRELSQSEVIVYNPGINNHNWFNAFSRSLFHVLKSIVDYNSVRNFLYQDYLRLFCPQRRLLAIGSIIEDGYNNCFYWGCGFMRSSSSFPGGIVRAVRGNLSKNKLRGIPHWTSIPIGDPALLLPLWKPVKAYHRKGVSIIPHWSEVDHFIKKYGNRYHIIDFRTNNIDLVLEEIQRSKYVLASSLHGLILSHAYRVPAIWIIHSDLGEAAESYFKFHDYFSSVKIPLYKGFEDIDTLLESKESLDGFFAEHMELAIIHEDLLHMQLRLLQVYPFILKDKYQQFLINNSVS